ncbi:MAG: J domain-containing protein [Geopsychrobacter sp.]|nr:J domain-containing protein [Geopsychrobacter sp.]
MSTKNYYQLLGVDPNASRSTIRKAYRKALRRHHPDANGGRRGGEAMLQRVLTAGRILCDPRQRTAYDKTNDLKTECSPLQPRKRQPVFSPYQKLLLSYQRIIVQGQVLWQKFFNAELAQATEARAAQQPNRTSPRFNRYLSQALNNRSLRYQLCDDGIYRKSKPHSRQVKGKTWPKKTALWLLIGVLLWGI